MTLDTVVDKSKGPPVGFVAQTGSFVSMDALSTIFLLLCLATRFSYFLLPYPGMFLFFVLLRLCSSHLLLPIQQVVGVLSSCVVFCILPCRNDFVFVCLAFFRKEFFVS